MARHFSWRDLCRRADKEFDKDSRKPITYRFGSGSKKPVVKREVTANSGPYKKES